MCRCVINNGFCAALCIIVLVCISGCSVSTECVPPDTIRCLEGELIARSAQHLDSSIVSLSISDGGHLAVATVRGISEEGKLHLIRSYYKTAKGKIVTVHSEDISVVSNVAVIKLYRRFVAEIPENHTICDLQGFSSSLTRHI